MGVPKRLFGPFGAQRLVVIPLAGAGPHDHEDVERKQHHCDHDHGKRLFGHHLLVHCRPVRGSFEHHQAHARRHDSLRGRRGINDVTNDPGRHKRNVESARDVAEHGCAATAPRPRK